MNCELLCEPRVSSATGGLFPCPGPKEYPLNSCLGSRVLGAAQSEFFVEKCHLDTWGKG